MQGFKDCKDLQVILDLPAILVPLDRQVLMVILDLQETLDLLETLDLPGLVDPKEYKALLALPVLLVQPDQRERHPPCRDQPDLPVLLDLPDQPVQTLPYQDQQDQPDQRVLPGLAVLKDHRALMALLDPQVLLDHQVFLDLLAQTATLFLVDLEHHLLCLAPLVTSGLTPAPILFTDQRLRWVGHSLVPAL